MMQNKHTICQDGMARAGNSAKWTGRFMLDTRTGDEKTKENIFLYSTYARCVRLTIKIIKIHANVGRDGILK